MTDLTIIIIIAILDLQFRIITVCGSFYIMYKFYNLFRTFQLEIKKDIKQLED